jgi:hypothetical protein
VGRNPKRYKANGNKKKGGGGERWVVGMFEERKRGSFTCGVKRVTRSPK